MWVPPNENVKLPVAIKVLNEESSATESRELLDEARIMASVVHPYCVRVVAVCMTARLMLVIPLMPLGSLLDYIRKNRDNIDSKRMLNWATQIARVSLVGRICHCSKRPVWAQELYYKPTAFAVVRGNINRVA